MLSLRRPGEEFLHQFLARQAHARLSYGFAGETRAGPVARRGWAVDRERVLLGHGAAVFERARAAIERWEMFPREVATVCGAGAPAVGLNVAVLYFAAPLGLWMLFPARVVYELD